MFESLRELLEGDVETSGKTIEERSVDWSLFKIHPSAVVFPKHTGDVQALVQWVNQHRDEYPNLSITARAAGTDMSGGPLNTGIIMDTTKYMKGRTRVKKLKEAVSQSIREGMSYDIIGEAKVLPGTYYRDLELKTLSKEMLMPCYPASKSICAVGGMVANNGAGERTLKYGQNKDFVKSLKVVLSDGNEYEVKPLSKKQLDAKISQRDFEGEIYRQVWNLIRDNWETIQVRRPKTTKNSAGYLIWDVLQANSIDDFVQGRGTFDLTKLFVGAQGTTGLITEITYKLVEYERRSDLLLIYVDDLGVVPDLVQRLMKSDLEMLEMYDDHTFKIGVKFFRDFIKDKGFWGAIKYGLRFMPEMWAVVTGGVPKLIVMAEFVSNDEEGLHREVDQAIENIRPLGLRMRAIKKDQEEEKFWDFRHDSFKLLTEHSKETRAAGEGTRTAPFIDDIAVNPEHLPEYLPRLIAVLEEYDLLYTVAGHLGNGNFHIIPLMDMTKEENRKKIIEVSDKVYKIALEYGGTITAEHNDGIIRTPYLEQQFGSAMVAVFQRVKKIFDPHTIFNPGKKVGGKKEDIERWLA